MNKSHELFENFQTGIYTAGQAGKYIIIKNYNEKRFYKDRIRTDTSHSKVS